MAPSFARSEHKHFHLWGTINCKVYSTNPNNKDDVTESIQDVGSSISQAQLPCAVNNMSLRSEVFKLVLLKIQVFCDVILCCSVSSSHVLREHSAFICKGQEVQE
jgi:hypothetical protein